MKAIFQEKAIGLCQTGFSSSGNHNVGKDESAQLRLSRVDTETPPRFSYKISTTADLDGRLISQGTMTYVLNPRTAYLAFSWLMCLCPGASVLSMQQNEE